jgi:MFS family permease
MAYKPFLSSPSQKLQMPPGFIALSAATFCVVMGVGLLPPVLPLYANQWNLSNTQAALLLSAFAAGRIPIAIPAGRASDRFGSKFIAYIGIFTAFISAILAIFADTYWLLLISIFIQGLGAGIFTTTSNAAVITNSDSESVGRLNSVYQGVILAGLCFAPALSGIAAQIIGLKGPFYLYFVALIFGTFLLFYAGRFMSDSSAIKGRQKKIIDVGRHLLTKPTFRVMIVASIVVFAALAGVRNTLLPLYAADVAGLNEIQIGWMLMASAVANILILYPAGRAVDVIGRRPVLVFGLFTMGVSVAFLIGMSSMLWLVFGAAIAGITKGIAAAPLPPLIADVAPNEMRAEAVGYYRVAVSIGLLCGPVILGGIVDLSGFSVAFLSASVFLIIMSLFLIRMPETGPIGQQREANRGYQ